MKYLESKLKYLFLFLLIQFVISCNGTPIGPPDNMVITSGLRGIVTDTSGQFLENVDVYCLYYNIYLPQDFKHNPAIQKLTKITDFDFSLEQNFPNPFNNSTFVRFSLPVNSSVTFSINDKATNKNVYHYSSNLPNGYSQLFIENIVDSLDLHNGLYTYTLSAEGENKINYSDTKTLFIISDKGLPNARSNNKGIYEFDYNYVFNGDTVVIKYNDDYSQNLILTNSVYLLFKKNGYYSKTVRVNLFANLFLSQDIVLIQESK